MLSCSRPGAVLRLLSLTRLLEAGLTPPLAVLWLEAGWPKKWMPL